MSKKNKICEKAVKLIAKKGYEKTSIDDVIHSCKIAKGTFYYYFKSKEDMFAYCINNKDNIFLNNLKEKVKNIPDATQKLKVVIEDRANYVIENIDLCRIEISELWCKEHKWKNIIISNLDYEYSQMIKDILLEGISKECFNKNIDIDSTALCIANTLTFSSINWLIYYPKRERNDFIKNTQLLFFRSVVKV